MTDHCSVLADRSDDEGHDSPAQSIDNGYSTPSPGKKRKKFKREYCSLLSS